MNVYQKATAVILCVLFAPGAWAVNIFALLEFEEMLGKKFPVFSVLFLSLAGAVVAVGGLFAIALGAFHERRKD